jgi:GxxExxY protein
LKAVKTISPEHEAQLLNYLKATGMRLGLLVNFGSYPNAKVERRILEILIFSVLLRVFCGQ